MNIRKATGTTFSLIVLVVGLSYLIPRALYTWAGDFHFVARFSQQYYIGSYHTFILNAALWIVIISGVLDAILRNRIALGLLGSLNVPIVLAIPVTIFASTPSVNHQLFWGLYYIIAILGVYWTFRKIISNNRQGQKLIPFIKGIKNNDGSINGHILDRYTVFGVSLLLVILWAVLILSFVVYLINNWQVMF